MVTDKEGKTHESTVWNATDLKNFPVQIVAAEHANATLRFKNVNLSKPAADQFQPPSDFTKYDDMRTMMMQTMMKRHGVTPPPGRTPTPNQ